MNISFYRNFITVVDCGTLSAAAEKLHIAQPAITQQIKVLESMFSVKLLDRGRSKKVTLTEAGKLLYRSAKSICLMEDTLETNIRELINGSRGVLQLALVSAPQERELSEMLIGFNRDYPNISYYIHERSSPEIMDMLFDGTIDVGFPRWPDTLPDNLTKVFSKRSPYRVYFGEDHPLFKDCGEIVPLKMLKDVSICIPHAIAERFQHACRLEGFSPKIICCCTNFPQSQIWANDVSVAVAASISDECEEGICCRELDHELLCTTQYICYCNDYPISSIGRTFIDFCREYYGTKK